MTITASDVTRVAAAIRLAGELFEVHGELMLNLTNDWRNGAKAANLDPDSGGNRWERCGDPTCRECPHALPADPTGEAAIADARSDLAAELQVRLSRLVDDAHWIRDTAHVLAPIVLPTTVNEKNDLWCSHHLKVGFCEVRHRGDLCRYCSDFMSLWKVRPPVSILRDRQQGKRITEQAVKDALAADGLILSTVGGVTKALRQTRPPKRNQNEKRRAG